jgi:3-hydroxymyristoyl/3-hydroxydecanoyl-(acyl carrier protein) dehydratase
MTGANTTRELRLPIPHEHRCFADHFPGAPLVPGALLLKWVIALLAEAGYTRINYLKQVKFLAPVQPGDDLRICITPGTVALAFAVTAYNGEILVLKGQFECVYD